MLKKSTKTLIRGVAVLLVVVMLFLYVTTRNRATANEPETIIGDVLILVEDSIYSNDQLKNQIKRYAEDIQKKLPYTRSVIVPLNKDNFPANKIANNVADYYYRNQLQGVVLIGDLALPLGRRDTAEFVTLYPYTDFVDPAFSYSESDNIFIYNKEVTRPQPEIWHGVIRAPRGAEDPLALLTKFFDDNHEYGTTGKIEGQDFAKKIFYVDPFNEEKAVILENLAFYKLYLSHLDDLVYQRYNKHFLKVVLAEQEKYLQALQQQLSQKLEFDFDGDGTFDTTADFGSLLEPTPAANVDVNTGSATDDNAQDLLRQIMPGVEFDIPDLYTKRLIKDALKEYLDVLGRQYLSTLTENVTNTGRFTENDLDTLPILITERDRWAQLYIKKINDKMEGKISDLVKGENGLQKPVRLINGYSVQQNVETGEYQTVQYFLNGYKPNEIENASQCSLQRGTPFSDAARISSAVEANRTFDPATAGNPATACNPYGGCCALNMHQPQFCSPQNAAKPIFDLIGARENDKDFSFLDCLQTKPISSFVPTTNINLSSNYKYVSSVIERVEPTLQTISAQEASSYPPQDIPVDNPRRISFQDGGDQERVIVYPNFFDLDSADQIDAYSKEQSDLLQRDVYLHNLGAFEGYLRRRIYGYRIDSMSATEVADFKKRFSELEGEMLNYFKQKLNGAEYPEDARWRYGYDFLQAYPNFSEEDREQVKKDLNNKLVDAFEGVAMGNGCRAPYNYNSQNINNFPEFFYSTEKYESGGDAVGITRTRMCDSCDELTENCSDDKFISQDIGRIGNYPYQTHSLVSADFLSLTEEDKQGLEKAIGWLSLDLNEKHRKVFLDALGASGDKFGMEDVSNYEMLYFVDNGDADSFSFNFARDLVAPAEEEINRQIIDELSGESDQDQTPSVITTQEQVEKTGFSIGEKPEVDFFSWIEEIVNSLRKFADPKIEEKDVCGAECYFTDQDKDWLPDQFEDANGNFVDPDIQRFNENNIESPTDQVADEQPVVQPPAYLVWQPKRTVLTAGGDKIAITVKLLDQQGKLANADATAQIKVLAADNQVYGEMSLTEEGEKARQLSLPIVSGQGTFYLTTTEKEGPIYLWAEMEGVQTKALRLSSGRTIGGETLRQTKANALTAVLLGGAFGDQSTSYNLAADLIFYGKTQAAISLTSSHQNLTPKLTTTDDALTNQKVGFYGSDQQIVHDFAQGDVTFGEATSLYPALNEILLGDPTLSLPLANNDASFDLSAGQRIDLLDDDPVALLSADYNFDGLDDLAVLTEQNVYLYEAAKAREGFKKKKEILFVKEKIAKAVVGDFVRDDARKRHYPDLVLLTQEGDLFLYTNSEQTWQRQRLDLGIDGQIADLFSADFDGDDNPDLLLMDQHAQVYIFYGDGLGSFQRQLLDDFSETLTQPGDTSQQVYVSWPGLFDSQQDDPNLLRVAPQGGSLVYLKQLASLGQGGQLVATKNLNDLDGGRLLAGDKVEVSLKIRNASEMAIDQINLADTIPSTYQKEAGVATASKTGPQILEAYEENAALLLQDLRLNPGEEITISYRIKYTSLPNLRVEIGNFRGDSKTDIILQRGQMNYIYENQGGRSFVKHEEVGSLTNQQPANPNDYQTDSDQDGLSDGQEIELGTDPHNSDTDSDGLSDRDESISGTDPLNNDSDGDSLPDGWEKQNGYDPSKYDSDGNSVADGLEDQNSDGRPNREEDTTLWGRETPGSNNRPQIGEHTCRSGCLPMPVNKAYTYCFPINPLDPMGPCVLGGFSLTGGACGGFFWGQNGPGLVFADGGKLLNNLTGGGCDKLAAEATDFINRANEKISEIHGQVAERLSVFYLEAQPPAEDKSYDPDVGCFQKPQMPPKNQVISGFPANFTDWFDNLIDNVTESFSNAGLPTVTVLYPDYSDIPIPAIETSQEVSNMTDVVAMLSEFPMLKVEQESIAIDVPFVSKEQFTAIKDSWQNALESWKKQLEDFKDYASKQGGEGFQNKTGEKAISTLENIFNENINILEENIKVLQKLADFPMQFMAGAKSYKEMYLGQIVEMLNAVLDVRQAWEKENLKRAKAWGKLYGGNAVESWLKILEVIKGYQNQCSKCTNDRFSAAPQLAPYIKQAIAPPTPPVVALPSLPDIIIDLHQNDPAITVTLPKFDFNFKPLALENITDPQLPALKTIMAKIDKSGQIQKAIDRGDYAMLQKLLGGQDEELTDQVKGILDEKALKELNTLLEDLDLENNASLAKLAIKMPQNLPKLPSLPPLPDLAGKIKIPTIPDIPPAPKIPKLFDNIDTLLDLFETYSQAQCFIKSSYYVPRKQAFSGVSGAPGAGDANKCEVLTERSLDPLLPIDFSFAASLPPLDFSVNDMIVAVFQFNFDYPKLNLTPILREFANKLGEISQNYQDKLLNPVENAADRVWTGADEYFSFRSSCDKDQSYSTHPSYLAAEETTQAPTDSDYLRQATSAMANLRSQLNLEGLFVQVDNNVERLIANPYLPAPKLALADTDGDNDSDVFYTVGKKLYLKKNRRSQGDDTGHLGDAIKEDSFNQNEKLLPPQNLKRKTEDYRGARVSVSSQVLGDHLLATLKSSDSEGSNSFKRNFYLKPKTEKKPLSVTWEQRAGEGFTVDGSSFVSKEGNDYQLQPHQLIGTGADGELKLIFSDKILAIIGASEQGEVPEIYYPSTLGAVLTAKDGRSYVRGYPRAFYGEGERQLELNNNDILHIGSSPEGTIEFSDGAELSFQEEFAFVSRGKTKINVSLSRGMVEVIKRSSSGADTLVGSPGSDSNGNGIADDFEAQYGLDSQNPLLAELDFDKDGLNNLQEYRFGTNPYNFDSDADGLSDGQEVYANLSPTSTNWFDAQVGGLILYEETLKTEQGSATLHLQEGIDPTIGSKILLGFVDYLSGGGNINFDIALPQQENGYYQLVLQTIRDGTVSPETEPLLIALDDFDLEPPSPEISLTDGPLVLGKENILSALGSSDDSGYLREFEMQLDGQVVSDKPYYRYTPTDLSTHKITLKVKDFAGRQGITEREITAQSPQLSLRRQGSSLLISGLPNLLLNIYRERAGSSDSLTAIQTDQEGVARFDLGSLSTNDKGLQIKVNSQEAMSIRPDKWLIKDGYSLGYTDNHLVLQDASGVSYAEVYLKTNSNNDVQPYMGQDTSQLGSGIYVEDSLGSDNLAWQIGSLGAMQLKDSGSGADICIVKPDGHIELGAGYGIRVTGDSLLVYKGDSQVAKLRYILPTSDPNIIADSDNIDLQADGIYVRQAVGQSVSIQYLEPLRSGDKLFIGSEDGAGNIINKSNSLTY